MTDIQLKPINKIPLATLDLPGSKSIANRVLPLAAISNGISTIHNIPSDSEDVALMLKALENLGVVVKDVAVSNGVMVKDVSIGNSVTAKSYEIHGCGGAFPNKNAEIFCGNSGTTIRFLGAILAVMGGNYVLDGVKRMHERPIKDLVVALRQIGANISYLKNEGYPPLKTLPFSDNMVDKMSISGKISSQYLTGVLLASSLLKRKLSIEVYDELISKPYVDITLALLAKFGVKTESSNTLILSSVAGKDKLQLEAVKRDDLDILGKALNDKNSSNVKSIEGKIANAEDSYKIDTSSVNNRLTGIEYTVEPDASSASYFLALGAINGDITINNLSENSLQGDRNFAKVLQLMGADVVYDENSIRVKTGRVMHDTHKLSAIEINMEDMPDVAMTIAVMALFADGTTTITGIHSWKVKETDRLLAIHNELTKLGAKVSITDSSITIMPPATINSNVAINTYNDHRMAMCFSLVAAYGVAVTIKDYECVNKTFPTYFAVFQNICYSSVQ